MAGQFGSDLNTFSGTGRPFPYRGNKCYACMLDFGVCTVTILVPSCKNVFIFSILLVTNPSVCNTFTVTFKIFFWSGC